MPVITADGRDVVKINGRTVKYQGIAHVRNGFPTETAVDRTKHNGLDEFYVNVVDEKNQTQRILIYGDRLDFSFQTGSEQPTVTVNGKAGKLIAFEDEQTSFWQGAIHGLKRGWFEAFDTLGDSSKKIIAGLALAGGTTIIGGGALGVVAAPVATSFLSVVGGAFMLIGLAGIFKGGFAALDNRPKMETIAAVTNEAHHLGEPDPTPIQQPLYPPMPIPMPPQQPLPGTMPPMRPMPPPISGNPVLPPVIMEQAPPLQ